MSAQPTQPLHERLLEITANPQINSILSRIPAEVREKIFSLALACFPDPSPERQYDAHEWYTHPGYTAPRKSDVRLLRTCRAIYRETWSLPYFLREHTHWLAGQLSALSPPWYNGYVESSLHMAATAAKVANQQGVHEVEIQHLQVFAYMADVEEDSLLDLLHEPLYARVAPRFLTVTVRPNRQGYWEGGWVVDLAGHIPSSVREMRIKFESHKSQEEEVRGFAKEMAEKWWFRRRDGVALFADVTGAGVKINEWSGLMEWSFRDHTWGGIEYYSATVVFRPRWVVEKWGGKVSQVNLEEAEKGVYKTKEDMRLEFCGMSEEY